MHLGICIEETWGFFNEIYLDLQQHHNTSVFKRRTVHPPFFRERLNRYLFRRDLQKFMEAQDVVFFEWASELLIAATHLPKSCGIVTRLHRYELYQWVDRINWQAVDHVILVSQAMEAAFLKKVPQMVGHTTVISPSTSLSKFSFHDKPFNGDIGTLCHLTPRKRVYDLVLAFYELSKENEGFHLHIAGGMNNAFGDYYEALHHLVDELNLQKKVTFYDHISEPEMWYKNIDIFVSNSYSEGLQVAPMEAMASGCYALSHRWNGAEELLPEKQLFYTSNELQGKILDFAHLSNSEKQEQKALMREIACTRFDINKTISEVRNVIENVKTQI